MGQRELRNPVRRPRGRDYRAPKDMGPGRRKETERETLGKTVVRGSDCALHNGVSQPRQLPMRAIEVCNLLWAALDYQANFREWLSEAIQKPVRRPTPLGHWSWSRLWGTMPGVSLSAGSVSVPGEFRRGPHAEHRGPNKRRKEPPYSGCSNRSRSKAERRRPGYPPQVGPGVLEVRRSEWQGARGTRPQDGPQQMGLFQQPAKEQTWDSLGRQPS
jgi:hypothetical protein